MLFDTENKSSAADFVPEEKKYNHIVATEDDSTITTKQPNGQLDCGWSFLMRIPK